MAFSLDFDAKTPFGSVKVLDSYVRATSVATSKNEAVATVDFFKAQNSQLLKQQTYIFPYDLEGPNPIKQAYLHLKTLPEFADAIDC